MTAQISPPRIPPDELNAVFRRLRRPKAQHETTMNKDELAELLIGAAILEGFDGGNRITGTLATLGMNRRHAGIILDRLTEVRWRHEKDGRYSLLEAGFTGCVFTVRMAALSAHCWPLSTRVGRSYQLR